MRAPVLVSTSEPIGGLPLGHTPTRLPRPRLAVLTAFTLALLAPARSEAGQVPAYGELPVGSVTSPASGARPASIPAGQSVPGVVITRGAASQPIVSGSDAPPRKRGGAAPDLSATRTCFSQPNHPLSSRMDPALGIPGIAQRPQEWEGELEPQAVVWRAPHGPQVTEVHIERVIERDGTTSLESMDVWIDATTLGARLVAKALLPLRQVGDAPGGLKLFAGRDERPDGKRYLQFVVVRGEEPAAHHLGAISGTRGGSILPSAMCSHARVALLASKPGESASLQLTTILPPLPPGELSLAPPPPEVPTPQGSSGKQYRVRPLRIHVSVSQTTRDNLPVLAVSTAWSGPEVVQRVFDPTSIPPAPPPFMPASVGPSLDPGF